MSKRQTIVTFLAGFWLTLIFVTSCFVVPFDRFVHFIQGLSDNTAFRQWFAGFWVISWLVVVKGWHAFEYAVLTCLGTITLHAFTKWERRKCVGIAFAFAVLFAISDEWHQSFVPNRDGNLRDVLVDTAGASIAALLLLRHPHRGAISRQNVSSYPE